MDLRIPSFREGFGADTVLGVRRGPETSVSEEENAHGWAFSDYCERDQKGAVSNTD